MAKPPAKGSKNLQVGDFLAQTKVLSVKARKVEGRVIFAIDATASRQYTWDQACHYQSQMFRAVDEVGGLAVQLNYFRGFEQFYASPWCFESDTLLKQMNGVLCEGGFTQIRKLLEHARTENKKQAVNALIYIGDAVEEDINALTRLAGELGMQKCPIFVFHEGNNAAAGKAFRDMARLSGGAYHAFNASSAAELGDLLSAIAVYATRGKAAVNNSRLIASRSVKALLEQLN